MLRGRAVGTLAARPDDCGTVAVSPLPVSVSSTSCACVARRDRGQGHPPVSSHAAQRMVLTGSGVRGECILRVAAAETSLRVGNISVQLTLVQRRGLFRDNALVGLAHVKHVDVVIEKVLGGRLVWVEARGFGAAARVHKVVGVVVAWSAEALAGGRRTLELYGQAVAQRVWLVGNHRLRLVGIFEGCHRRAQSCGFTCILKDVPISTCIWDIRYSAWLH